MPATAIVDEHEVDPARGLTEAQVAERVARGEVNDVPAAPTRTWGPSQAFFALDDPPLIVWLAGFGIAAIVWSFARLFVPGEQPVGPRARDPLFGGLTRRREARSRPDALMRESGPDQTR